MDDRYAVLIGNGTFTAERRLSGLRCPRNDVEGLSRVLTSAVYGRFSPANVRVLVEAKHHEALREINRVLRGARKRDLVVLYYSGHGKQDGAGRLHLASADTDLDLLESTSIPVASLRNFIDASACKKVVLILDCCYSGAAGEAFLKGDVRDQLQTVSDVRGTYVLAASTATQVAREKETDQYSLMTKHIIGGIEEGRADRDGDGLVTLDELFAYVHDQVCNEGPQIPEKYSLSVRGDLIIAHTGRIPREERRSKLSRLVHDMHRDRLIPDDVLHKALEVVGRAPWQMDDGMRQRDELLDGLLSEQIEAADFSERWLRVEASADAEGFPQQTGQTATDDRRGRSDAVERAPVRWQVCATLSPHVRGTLCAAFSPKGGYLACGAGDGGVRIWNVDRASLDRELREHRSPVWCVCFSSDGSRLASAGRDGSVRLWDMRARRMTRTLGRPGECILTAAFHPTSADLATSGFDDRVTLWNSETGEPRASWSAGQGIVHALAISPDGGIVASAGSNGTVRIWDSLLGSPIAALPGHRGAVHCLAFSADGRWMASGGRDGVVRIWDTRSWLIKRLCRGHEHSVWAVAFDSEGRLAGSASSDRTVALFDVGTGTPVASLPLEDHCVQCLAFHPCKRLFVSGGTSGIVRCWREQKQRQVAAGRSS